MAGSLNRVMLIGRLTRDPELRFTPSGTAVCQLAMATNRYGSDPQSGERREYTDYHDVVVWNQGNRKLAELCSQYLQKGRLVYVEGRMQTRSWEDQQSGQKRYRTEVNANDVQFLDSRQDGGGPGGGPGPGSGTADAEAGAGAGAHRGAGTAGEAGGDIDPNDIPF